MFSVGMMTLWNAANGPSIHAELVGREWVKMDHQLRVFSPRKHPDARPTLQKDEDYIIRHYSVNEVLPVTKANYFDPLPLIKEDYNVFVAQNVERLPTKELYEKFPDIRKKAATVMVVHEGGSPLDLLYYKFSWDIIICFDERYEKFISKHFPEQKIRIIPYPCHPLELSNKKDARKKLGLSMDEKIILFYGFRTRELYDVLPTLKEVAYEIPIKYLIIANPDGHVQELEGFLNQYSFVELRKSALPLCELYDFLHASDALLIHRKPNTRYRAVISSSVCLALGSGCPILFHDVNYVEKHHDEIIKYRNMQELKKSLLEIFEGKSNLDKVKAFLERRNANVVASKFIDVFQEALETRK
ncbi:MAG: hypothetical protein NWE90_02200 [Candidatus Bathyarchaeota archaeon]|nr:hypothetical protein [Candidatus Bathyarchaeota archaeon]